MGYAIYHAVQDHALRTPHGQHAAFYPPAEALEQCLSMENSESDTVSDPLSYSLGPLPCLWREHSFYFPSFADDCLWSLLCLPRKGKCHIDVYTVWRGRPFTWSLWYMFSPNLYPARANLVRFPDQAACQASSWSMWQHVFGGVLVSGDVSSYQGSFEKGLEEVSLVEEQGNGEEQM